MPYYDEGGSYYSSGYAAIAPTYYAGGVLLLNGGGYYTPLTPYLQRGITSRHRVITRSRGCINRRAITRRPRYYQPSRGDYRAHQNHGWDGRNRGGWNNDYRGHDGRSNRGGRGDHNGRGGHR